MILSKKEFNRMEYLLGKHRLSVLSFQDENELRNLIVKERPSARNSVLDDLINLGLVFVGVHVLFGK